MKNTIMEQEKWLYRDRVFIHKRFRIKKPRFFSEKGYYLEKRTCWRAKHFPSNQFSKLFGKIFRLSQRAYCRLHIYPRPGYDICLRMLYPFRSVFQKWDHIGLIHKITALFVMQNYAKNRSCIKWGTKRDSMKHRYSLFKFSEFTPQNRFASVARNLLFKKDAIF